MLYHSSCCLSNDVFLFKSDSCEGTSICSTSLKSVSLVCLPFPFPDFLCWFSYLPDSPNQNNSVQLYQTNNGPCRVGFCLTQTKGDAVQGENVSLSSYLSLLPLLLPPYSELLDQKFQRVCSHQFLWNLCMVLLLVVFCNPFLNLLIIFHMAKNSRSSVPTV